MKTTELSKQSIFLTVGYPGSGKSYLSRQLADTLGVTHISADRIRYELFDQPQYSRDEDAIVARIQDYMIEELLRKGLSVVCDGDFGLRKSRRLKYDFAKQYSAQPVLLWVQTDLETSFTRASKRDKRKPDDRYSPSLDQEMFDKLVARLKKPENEPTIVVSGKHVYKIQLKNVIRRLQQHNLLKESTEVTPQINRVERKVLKGRTQKPVARNRQPLRVIKDR